VRPCTSLPYRVRRAWFDSGVPARGTTAPCRRSARPHSLAACLKDGLDPGEELRKLNGLRVVFAAACRERSFPISRQACFAFPVLLYSCRVASQPSSSGMFRSIRTRSGFSASAVARPALPSSAVMIA
jgi:hypothetical protein